ncbi:hypothetical protein Leryth_008816 [Lithospermum erythrorhizon]|nr:hypothetical protein Leryth_008816 [Lithospermum erythrorhizon]
MAIPYNQKHVLYQHSNPIRLIKPNSVNHTSKNPKPSHCPFYHK